MIDLIRMLVKEVKIPLHEVVAMASATPAKALHSTTKGRLETGADADFVVISQDLEVLQTYVGGEEIYRRDSER